MSDKQPEALREAIEWLETSPTTRDKLAAAELRRLHEVNAELVEALKEAIEAIDEWGAYASPYFQNKYDLQSDINKAKAALAKATGENNG